MARPLKRVKPPLSTVVAAVAAVPTPPSPSVTAAAVVEVMTSRTIVCGCLAKRSRCSGDINMTTAVPPVSKCFPCD